MTLGIYFRSVYMLILCIVNTLFYGIFQDAFILYLISKQVDGARTDWFTLDTSGPIFNVIDSWARVRVSHCVLITCKNENCRLIFSNSSLPAVGSCPATVCLAEQNVIIKLQIDFLVSPGSQRVSLVIQIENMTPRIEPATNPTPGNLPEPNDSLTC